MRPAQNGRTCRGLTRKGMAGAGAGVGRMGGHVGDGPGRGRLELGLGQGHRHRGTGWFIAWRTLAGMWSLLNFNQTL